MITRFATSPDSTRIAFDVNGTGTPILLLRGGGGSRTDWHEQGYVARLAKEFTVIAINLRGHGESDKPIDPDSYSTEKWDRIFSQWLTHAGLNASSFGDIPSGEMLVAIWLSAQTAFPKWSC